MHIKLIIPQTSKPQSFLQKLLHPFQNPLAALSPYTNNLYDTDEVDLINENVDTFNLDDTPNLVMIQVSTASAQRAYELAKFYRDRGCYVCLTGMHVTFLPDEAAKHANTIILGPHEETWNKFIQDFRLGTPRQVYQSPDVASNLWLITYLAMYTFPKAYS